MDAPLKTWKLIPIAITSALWSLTTFATVAYVRAPGPFEARLLAAERFRKFGALNSVGRKLCSPCLDPDLVYCVEVADRRFRVLQLPCVLTEEEAFAIAPSMSSGSEPSLAAPPPSAPVRSLDWSELSVAKK
jgi:hypothetical protein